jgi:aromatic ring hydroxylase
LLEFERIFLARNFQRTLYLSLRSQFLSRQPLHYTTCHLIEHSILIGRRNYSAIGKYTPLSC